MVHMAVGDEDLLQRDARLGDAFLELVEIPARIDQCAAAIGAAQSEALQFALQRGSRSGRIALQFARQWAGQRLSSVRPA